MIRVGPSFPRIVVSILLLASNLFAQRSVALSWKEREEVPPFALLKGTCFDQRGFSLPGVAILVRYSPEGKKEKVKQWRVGSDRRGEFAVRLPAGEGTVFVTANKKGFETVEQSVQFHNDEQQHIVVQLRAVSTPK